MSDPVLVIAAWWQETEEIDAGVIEALKAREPVPHRSRGFAVTYSSKTASLPSFQHVLQRLDLAELNERPL